MDVFTEYLAKIDNPNQRKRTEEVLKWIAQTYPNLVPQIKWNQPMFTDHGTFIIGFSVSKKHLAFAPEADAIAHFSEEIVKTGYDHSQNLARIPWGHPVDYALLEKIIAFNISDKADCSTFWRK